MEWLCEVRTGVVANAMNSGRNYYSKGNRGLATAVSISVAVIVVYLFIKKII
jgi:hypothetical protein